MQLRIPVVSKDGKPLMPAKPSRVRRWLEQGKAIKKWADVGLFYVQLTEPTGNAIQPITVGIDPGKLYSGIDVTPSPFFVIRRPLISRRQLHLMVPAKGGVRRKYGGTTTRHRFRKGDLVNSPKGIGFVSGDTAKQVSVSDSNWKRLGQIAASKIVLIHRSTGIVVQGG